MYIKTIINQLFFLYVKNIKYFFSHICSKKQVIKIEKES